MNRVYSLSIHICASGNVRLDMKRMVTGKSDV